MADSLVIEPEAAERLLREYGLRLVSLTRIWKGTISQNYRVMTDVGPLFLRVSAGRSVADAEFETQLTWHLLSHGLRVPALFQAHNRQGYVKLPGSVKGQFVALAMLYEWVDGYERTDGEFDEAHALEVGQLLGQLHLCTSTLNLRREGIYTPSHIRRRLKDMVRHPRWNEALLPTLDRLNREIEAPALRGFGQLPSGIGHCDLFPDNILFPTAKAKRKQARRSIEVGPWMIDLEQAAWTPLLYDLAVSLLACTSPVPSHDAGHDVGTDKPLSERQADKKQADEKQADEKHTERTGPLMLSWARSMVAGYQRMRLITDEEWTALPALLRFCCVRFATTRLTDIHLSDPMPSDGEPNKPASATGTVHSKDYRDYLWRLDRLDETSSEELIHKLR